MRQKLNFLALLIALLGIANLAQAAPLYSDIAYDTFNYPAGELNGLGGGSGWTGNWTANTSVTEILNSTAIPMSYNVSGGGQVIDGARILRVSGNNDTAIQRTMSASQTAPVYISFLFRFNGTIDNNDFVAIWFGTGTAHTGPNIGFKANQGDGSGTRDFFVRPYNVTTPPVTAYAPTNAVAGTTYFVVGRVARTGTNYDNYQLWVNPAFGDSGTPQAQLTADGVDSIPNFNRIGLRSVNLDVGDSVDISGIHIGTTWAQVVPAPGDVLAIQLQEMETTAATPLWLIAFAAVLVLLTVGRFAPRQA